MRVRGMEGLERLSRPSVASLQAETVKQVLSKLQRIDMFEPPHMHTTMLFIPQHTAPPTIGDTIDLQRPLAQTIIDEVIWV